MVYGTTRENFQAGVTFMKHGENISNDDHLLARWNGWVGLSMWLTTLSLLTSVGGVIYITYELEVATPIHTALLILVAFVVLSMHAGILIILNMLRFTIYREHKFNQLRFDVYAAVHEALGWVLKDHLPSIRAILTQLDVGEALVAEIKMITSRRAKLQTVLATALHNGQLTVAIDKMIAEAMKQAGLKGQVDDLVKIHEALEEKSSVINFPTKEK